MARRGQQSSPEETRRRALAIARVLRFEPGTFAGRERQAYHIMSHLAGIPTIADHGRRRAYGIEVLENANRLMPYAQPQNAQFSWRLRELVASMQTFPAWHTVLTRPDAALVNDYLNLKLITDGMDLIGMGGIAGITGDIAKGGLQGAQRAAAGAATRMGGVVRGGLAGARGAITGGLAGSLGLVWVIGSVALVALKDRLRELGQEITRRYQEGRMTAQLYQRALGDDVPMPERFLTGSP